MRRTIQLGLLSFLVPLTMLWGGVIKNSPTAYPTHEGHIKVSWQTEDETGVMRFEVWRSQIVGGVLGDFMKVGSIEQSSLRGNNSSYEFVDQSVFKTAGNVFAYKVRVVFQSGAIFDSDITRTSSTTSAAKRTWGSIKAMFR
ncbi:MAG TPA: hypothetical protein DCP63_13300 [Bacteroidetes bacterium]|nr:hypothetical protein [Bacteroidota bacterium]